MNKLVFKDELNDCTVEFITDASQSTIESLPEVEWHAVKSVLTNFGYTVIEINRTEN
jgi:hypothetical protein